MLSNRPTTQPWPTSALDAELAYRQEMLRASARDARTRRGGWFRNRRRSH